MLDPNKAKILVAWLTDLSRLTAPVEPEAVTVMANLLDLDFASTVFTAGSLHFVLDQIEGWPSYRALREALRGWLADQTPEVAAPAAPDALRFWDQRWLDYWHMRVAEIDGSRAPPEGREKLAGATNPETARANLASLIREQAPGAWSRIASGQT